MRTFLCIATLLLAGALPGCQSDSRYSSTDHRTTTTHGTPAYGTTRYGEPIDRYEDDEIGFYVDNYFGGDGD